MIPCQRMDESCNTLVNSPRLTRQKTPDFLHLLTARIPVHLLEPPVNNFPNEKSFASVSVPIAGNRKKDIP